MGKLSGNDKCPCGSGKKYKYCCGSANVRKTTIESSNISAVLFDFEKEKEIILTKDMLINQICRDSQKIGEKFDVLCNDEFKDLSFKFSKIAGIFIAGINNITDDRENGKITCALMLHSCLDTFTSALLLLRSGYPLQSLNLLRIIFETVSVVAYLILKPEETKNVKTGKIKATETFNTSKQLFPDIGEAWGQCSAFFSHVSEYHRDFNPPQNYNSKNEALYCTLTVMYSALLKLHVVTERVFLDSIQTPEFWEYYGEHLIKMTMNKHSEYHESLRKFIPHEYFI